MLLNPTNKAKKQIDRLFFVNYLLMAVNLSSFVFLSSRSGFSTALFDSAALIAYAFIYLIPAGLILGLLRGLTGVFRISERWYSRFFIYAIAVLVFTGTHLVIIVDRVIYKMYGFHFNGFVWNLLTTKGGIESMGFDTMAYWTSAGGFLGAILVEVLLLMACIHWERFKVSRVTRVPHLLRIATPYVAVVMFSVQGLFFGVSSFKGNSSVLAASNTFLFFVPITFRSTLENMGFEPNRNAVLTTEQPDNLALQYPLKDIRQSPDGPRYNIVWLVAESWRADMLTEDIMPQTWKFAQKSQHFLNHYSGGNGTREAMFSMFYGLYGNYWSKFLSEQRSPVLMDLLQQNDYQIDLYTSARFTYPEFDKTLFSRIPAEHLDEQPDSVGWKSDRINVTQMLDFIASRDTSKPFMTFLFFESPHARYYFPPECEIRKDYLKEFNYATADIQQDIGLIFNRYVNSCNHLDTQFARVIDDLQKNKLLDSTIVIITGDHGEEFMEHGRWGHNSTFVEEQIRIPLAIWVPGMKPAEYTKLTSHLDITPTVMDLLGVENPPSDYSLGFDLFSDQQRQYTIFSDWDSLGYRDSDCKIVLPLKASAAFENEMTTADDKEVADPLAAYGAETQNLVRVLREAGEFTKTQ